VHGFLTRDGTPPRELLRLARAEFAPYDTVEFQDVAVLDVCRAGHGFEVMLQGGARERCRKLLIATGLIDEVPRLEGIESLLGTSVHHCPYCDGWEHRGRRIAAYGRGDRGHGLALGLTVWAQEVVLLSDGPCTIAPRERERLEAHGIALRQEAIVRLEGRDGRLERVVFAGGPPLECDALFFATEPHQHSDLAAALGCEFTDTGTVDTGWCESTNVPGVFVAGDASKETQLVAVAVAEGSKAGFAINHDLLKEELAAREQTLTRRDSA
jgi:thioredoxin reductase